MGVIARLKQSAGTWRPPSTVTASSTLTVQPDQSMIPLTGTTQITTISSGQDILPGRRLMLLRADATIPKLTNSLGTSTAGSIDFGITDTVFQLTDSVSLIQQNNGSWRRDNAMTN